MSTARDGPLKTEMTPKFASQRPDCTWQRELHEERPRSTQEMRAELEDLLVSGDWLDEPLEVLEVARPT